MNRPRDTQKPAEHETRNVSSKQQMGPRTIYLILYNLVSAALWSVVLSRVIWIDLQQGYPNALAGVGEFVRWTQTLAGMEVLHAAIGLVRAPLLTTLMQVASRFLLVWGVVWVFPDSVAAPSPVYSSMLIAWSVTEVIRYSYFVVSLAWGAANIPAGLTFLRYNTFLVLYPLGIGSECWLIWKAIGPAKKFGPLMEWSLVAVLLIYVPGSYILFTHMLAQRKKVMRGLREKKTA